MFLDANASAQDYWLQQIHVMAHRLERVPNAAQLQPALARLAAEEMSRSGPHPFRLALDRRRADFKRHWLQPRF
jgi:hypothetical protein